MVFTTKVIPFIVGFFVFSTSVFSQIEVYQLDTAVAVHYLSPMRDGLRSKNHVLKQKSIEYATQNGYSKDWGMVDVFRELRGGNAPNTSP